jgi:hypothetical protein
VEKLFGRFWMLWRNYTQHETVHSFDELEQYKPFICVFALNGILDKVLLLYISLPNRGHTCEM